MLAVPHTHCERLHARMAGERRRSGRLGVPRGNPVQGMVDGVIGVAGKPGARAWQWRRDRTQSKAVRRRCRRGLPPAEQHWWQSWLRLPH